MEVEATEEELLKMLQAGVGGSFIQILSLTAKTLHEYTGAKVGNYLMGKRLNDELFGVWHEEKFARATHPVTRWMLSEIDKEIESRKLAVKSE